MSAGAVGPLPLLSEAEKLAPGDRRPGYGGAKDDRAEPGAAAQTQGRAAIVRALPDLTERLIQAGIYAEYNSFRARYLEWRKGGTAGAAGELTASSLQQGVDNSHFEYWYPSPSIFKWRYTCAYWQSILNLVGSLLFTFDAYVQYFQPPGGDVLTRTWPNAIGATLFSVGGYFAYLQLINLSKDAEERIVHFWPDWGELVARAEVSSVIGTVSYLLGALIFNVAAVMELFPNLPWKFLLTFVDTCNVLGGLAFALGGFCEMVHNGVCMCGTASSWTPGRRVWWTSVLNFVGGVCFAAGAVPGVVAPSATGWGVRSFVYLNYLVGSAMYVLTSVLMVTMWRANDFGMALIGQLNFALQSGGTIGVHGPQGARQIVIRAPELAGPPEPEAESGLRPANSPRRSSSPATIRTAVEDSEASTAAAAAGEAGRPQKGEAAPAGSPPAGAAAATATSGSSLRGALFIVIYCWFMFVAIVNCLCREQQFKRAKEQFWMELILDLAMQVFVVVVIALVLVVHSVITEIPDEQPYWCALVTTRTILTMGSIVQTIWFVKYMLKPNYDTGSANALKPGL